MSFSAQDHTQTAHIQGDTHEHTHVDTRAHTRGHTHAHRQTHVRAHARKHRAHTHSLTHSHGHTHACARACARTHALPNYAHIRENFSGTQWRRWNPRMVECFSKLRPTASPMLKVQAIPWILEHSMRLQSLSKNCQLNTMCNCGKIRYSS